MHMHVRMHAPQGLVAWQPLAPPRQLLEALCQGLLHVEQGPAL